ncbi:hypothetical protein D3C75_416120 [compost metagenome]
MQLPTWTDHFEQAHIERYSTISPLMQQQRLDFARQKKASNESVSKHWSKLNLGGKP